MHDMLEACDWTRQEHELHFIARISQTLWRSMKVGTDAFIDVTAVNLVLEIRADGQPFLIEGHDMVIYSREESCGQNWHQMQVILHDQFVSVFVLFLFFFFFTHILEAESVTLMPESHYNATYCERLVKALLLKRSQTLNKGIWSGAVD